MLQRVVGSCAVLVVLTVARSAHADDARYQNIIVGARAAGMGGAFTAIADDASGLMYNPAGMVDVKRANLSVSSSLYGFSRRSRGGLFKDLPSLTNRPQLSTAEINVIPSAAGTVMGLGDLLPDGTHRHAVGFGILVPDLQSSTLETSPPEGVGLHTRSRMFDRTLWAGVGYAFRFNPTLRAGLALHYVLRTVDVAEEYTFVGQDPQSGQTEVQSLAANLQLQSGSLVPVLGIKATPFPHLLVGLSVTGISFQLHHSGTFSSRKVNAGPGGARFFQEDVRISEGPEANLGPVGARTPVSLRAGLAWVETADWTATADVAGYLPVSYDLVDRRKINVDDVPLATQVKRGPVANVAVGFEKLVARSFSLAVGGFTNISSAPAITVQEDGTLKDGSSRLSRVHQVGTTFALGYFNEYSLSRVGFMSTFGVGDHVVVKDRETSVHTGTPPRFQRVAGSEWSFHFYLSSTFRYGAGRSERLLFGLPSPDRLLRSALVR